MKKSTIARLMRRPPIAQRVDYILKACKGKCVLHVGCADAPYTSRRIADGTILYPQIEKVALAQYGIDSNADGIRMLKEAGYRSLAVGNVEDMLPSKPFGDTDFDIIVAGEIIEHLSNPGRFLDSIRPLLRKPGSALVLTTVNAYSAYRFVYALLFNDEMVHPEHVYYFSQKTLARLLSQHGLEISDFAFYPVGREHEKALKHGRFWILWFADRFALRVRPILADGVMAICRPSWVETGTR